MVMGAQSRQLTLGVMTRSPTGAFIKHQCGCLSDLSMVAVIVLFDF